ncbi:MAG TPA: hypothetical protein VK866_12845 [Acidimicrobiales bacterium]|nr:hypothetical protein [Acidimicrobiales bacterium]
MLGAIIVGLIVVVGIPVGVLVSGAVASAILGWSLRDHAEATHEGSELVDLNV